MLSNALLQSLNIKGLADDSRRVKSGDLFFSFPGENSLTFVKKALEQGALAIVAETEVPFEMKSKWIQVKNVKEARLEAAIYFFGNPFEKLND